MIRNYESLRVFEDELLAKEKLTLEEKYKILNAMLDEARSLGVFPPKDPLDGLDEKISFVRALHSCSKKPSLK